MKDTGDLLILRETLLEELGPVYMWLINLSLFDWKSLSDEDKELNTQMRLARQLQQGLGSRPPALVLETS